MRYLELAQELRSRIASGVYPNGGCIESEGELVRACGVSRTTVRKALEVLRRDGLIASRKGSGWFVSARPHHQAVGSLPLAEAAIGASGAVVTRRVLAYGYEAPSRPVAATLGLVGGVQVLRVTTIVSTDGLPLGRQTAWLREEVAAPIGRSAFEQTAVSVAVERHGVEVGRVSQTISAGLATRALAALGTTSGAPVLICRGLARDRTDIPAYVFEDFYRADRMAFDVEIPQSIRTNDGLTPFGTSSSG